MYRPGEQIEHLEESLLGHGIYSDTNARGERVAVASLRGEVQHTDRLATISQKSPWYSPCVGDVVVGKVTGIANKRWYADINAKTETVLLLTAINLAGNVQRRKGELDEIMMHEYYAPGDILIAEVQSSGQKTQLHTRNERYAKVPFGVLLQFPPDAVEKGRTQFQTCAVGGREVSVVLGLNGYVAVHGSSSASREIKEAAQALLRLCARGVRLGESSLRLHLEGRGRAEEE